MDYFFYNNIESIINGNESNWIRFIHYVCQLKFKKKNDNFNSYGTAFHFDTIA